MFCVALDYSLATMVISLSMGQAMMSMAAPVWWSLLYEEGLSATCREELEEEYRISWILFYLHGGSHTSIGHRLMSNKRVVYPGGGLSSRMAKRRDSIADEGMDYPGALWPMIVVSVVTMRLPLMWHTNKRWQCTPRKRGTERQIRSIQVGEDTDICNEDC